MNQRYGYNDGNRGQQGYDMQDGGRGERPSGPGYYGRGQEGNYEGDWGGRGGQSGYPEQRGRQFDPQGWGESNADVRRGGEYGDRGSSSMSGGGYGDRGDYYLREWAGGGRGGQQDFSSRDFGGQGGGRAYGSADMYGRSDQRGGAHGYGNQGYGNQGFANRNYDNQGYRREGGGYYQGGQHGGDYQGNQGYLQGQESFGQRRGENFGQDPEYGRGGSGFSPMRTDRSQSFRGKGPKGYKRSDERLQEDISERLMDDDRIDASDVSVRCKDGVVTLEGSVSERQVKHRIEDLVERCHGVKDIENRITVQRASQERPDADDEDSGDADRGQSASGGQKKKH